MTNNPDRYGIKPRRVSDFYVPVSLIAAIVIFLLTTITQGSSILNAITNSSVNQENRITKIEVLTQLLDTQHKEIKQEISSLHQVLQSLRK